MPWLSSSMSEVSLACTTELNKDSQLTAIHTTDNHFGRQISKKITLSSPTSQNSTKIVRIKKSAELHLMKFLLTTPSTHSLEETFLSSQETTLVQSLLLSSYS